MKVLRVSTRNVRGVPDGEFSLERSAARPGDGAPLDVVLVTGPSGSGKTSFLETIAAMKEIVGPYGRPPMLATLLKRGEREGRIEVTWSLSEAEAKRARLGDTRVTTAVTLGEGARAPLFNGGLREVFAELSTERTAAKVEYFPSNRSLGGSGRSSDLTDKAVRLAKPAHKYGSVARTLVDLAAKDALAVLGRLERDGMLLGRDQGDSFGPYRTALERFVPDLRLRGVEAREDRLVPTFERRSGAILTLDELSDSEQQAVLFSVTAHELGLEGSLLLVDTPELYVPRHDQLSFFRAIRAFGAHNQIVAASTSSEILGDVSFRDIIDLGSFTSKARR